jgi:hypothetical protein
MNRRAFLAGLLITPFFINGVLAGATASSEPKQVDIKVNHTNGLEVGDYFTIAGLVAKKGGRSIKGLQVFSCASILDGSIAIEPLYS